jgi:nitrite reductase (NADH) small subunit
MRMAGARMRVAEVGEVPPDSARVVEVGGHTLALCNVGGAFYAVDNLCPHRGGPLGEGDLDGVVLTCPWHAWQWDVTTGANVNNPVSSVGCFRVSVDGQGIFVELP